MANVNETTAAPAETIAAPADAPANLTVPFTLPGGDIAQAHVCTWGNLRKPCVVLLHGFMQRGSAWQQVAAHLSECFYVVAPDLIGHGETSVPPVPENYSFDAYLAEVGAVIDFFGRHASLVGYSMGGRIASVFATAVPDAVDALVLESAGLGPASEEARATRAKKTAATVARLREQALPDFIDFWESLPLFESQRALPPEVRAQVRASRLANNPEALALSSEYAGQDKMPDVRPALAEGRVPILYLAGEMDAAYTEVAASLARAHAAAEHSAPCFEVEVVPGCGHNIHLENSAAFVQRVAPFLKAHSNA